MAFRKEFWTFIDKRAKNFTVKPEKANLPAKSAKVANKRLCAGVSMNLTNKFAANKIKKPSKSLQSAISTRIFLFDLKISMIVYIGGRHSFFEDFIRPSLINQHNRDENRRCNRHKRQSVRRRGGIINIQAEIGRNARNH